MHLDDIQTIAVLGAGTMGAGIAQLAAQHGYETVLYDVADEVLAAATDRIAHFINRLAEKGRLPADEADAAIARLRTTSALDGVAGAQVVIEAAPERLDLKQRIFADLEAHVGEGTILATNTSTLSVTEIAAATKRPGRVVGMHFFNPPALMPLVEVIAGAQSEAAVVDTTVALAEALGKTPVRASDTPGFIVNRVARPFHLEGLRLLESGIADLEIIDRLFREEGGFRMGPFELQDLIGIDINCAASQSVYEAFHHAARFRPSIRQRQQVQSGHLGKKTGRGWYGQD